jgi:hypothetical protein
VQATSAEPVVLKFGNTTVRIVPPAPVSERERQIRHEAIVRAAAECWKESMQKQV